MTTNEDLLSTIRSLPVTEQYDLATQILDNLARAGGFPISEEMMRILDERIKEADEHPEMLVPAQEVFDELSKK